MKNSENRRYAGFWIRTLASAIDVVLLLLITTPLLVWAYGLEFLIPPLDTLPESQQLTQMLFRPPRPLEIWLQYVLPTIALVIFWKYRSATPGKMIVSARIVDAVTGEKPTFKQCIVRCFAYFVSTIPLGLGFLWITFDARKQAWHDKLAGTVVVLGSKTTNMDNTHPK
jgi:uncharacterized RDD family membrane protein YckC